MKQKIISLALVTLIVLLVVGCGASPTPTPALTQPPQIITVVVTATPPPATAAPAQPTPTLTVATTTTATVALQPTQAPVTPKPSATKKPTVPAPTVTPTPVPLTRSAPKLIGPNFNPDLGRKDERHSPSDALVFEWESIGPLGPNECYMIRVDFEPGAGDSFLQCDPSETQKAQSQTTRFTLNQPTHGGPNYSGLLPDPPNDLTVKWSVTIVRDDGVGPDGVHHKTTPLSPKSDTFQFLLKSGGP